MLTAGGHSHPGEWQATGGVEVKGKGVMQTFLLLQDTQAVRLTPHSFGMSSEAVMSASSPRTSRRKEKDSKTSYSSNSPAPRGLDEGCWIIPGTHDNDGRLQLPLALPTWSQQQPTSPSSAHSSSSSTMHAHSNSLCKTALSFGHKAPLDLRWSPVPSREVPEPGIGGSTAAGPSHRNSFSSHIEVDGSQQTLSRLLQVRYKMDPSGQSQCRVCLNKS